MAKKTRYPLKIKRSVNKRGTKDPLHAKHSVNKKVTKVNAKKRTPHPAGADASTPSNNINWRSLVALNEEPDVSKNLRQKLDWDFRHFPSIVQNLKKSNPDRHLFVVGGPAFVLPDERICPTVVVLSVPAGRRPPTYVLRKNPADHQDDRLVRFEDFGLVWKPFGNRRLGEGVFALKTANDGGGANPDIAASKLWTIPRKDMERKKNGDLKIEIANYRYRYIDGGGKEAELDEVYSKGFSSFSMILDMNDLDLMEHIEPLKEAVKEGFNAARDKMEDRLAMLQKEFPSHDDYEMIKIFPQDAFDGEVTGNTESLCYFNEFYGKANETYLKVDSAGRFVKV